MPPTIDLKTLPAIARKIGCTDRQAEYAVKVHKIEATGRIGIVRVFDVHAADQIKSAVDQISLKKGVVNVA